MFNVFCDTPNCRSSGEERVWIWVYDYRLADWDEEPTALHFCSHQCLVAWSMEQALDA